MLFRPLNLNDDKIFRYEGAMAMYSFFLGLSHLGLSVLLKSFGEKLKVGFTAMVPFRKSYIYKGSEARGVDYYHYSEGNVSLPGGLLILKQNTSCRISRAYRGNVSFSRKKLTEVIYS